MDIAQLSDAELRAKLIEYGVNAGPIGATTRLFYEKKLGKLIDSGGMPQKEDTEEEEDEEDEEEVEDEEVQINYRTAPRTYASPAATTPVQRKHEQVNVSQNYTPITKARQATVNTPQPGTRPTTASSQRPGASKPTKTSGSGGSGIAMWIKLQPGTRPTTASSQRLGASKPTKTSGGGSGIAMWIKLLFIVVVVLLMYLVIINMNQSAQSKIPITHEEV